MISRINSKNVVRNCILVSHIYSVYLSTNIIVANLISFRRLSLSRDSSSTISVSYADYVWRPYIRQAFRALPKICSFSTLIRLTSFIIFTCAGKCLPFDLKTYGTIPIFLHCFVTGSAYIIVVASRFYRNECITQSQFRLLKNSKNFCSQF